MSSAIALSIPAEYGYVLATATLSSFVALWHSIHVGRHRRSAKVPYPNAYASAADAKADTAKYLFNCAQRAHANLLEHLPVFLSGLLIGGLRYPAVSAGMGAAWCAARVMYTVGYTSERKENGTGRRLGTWFWGPEIGLQVCAGLTAWGLLSGR